MTVGTASNGTDNDFSLARFTNNGALDTSLNSPTGYDLLNFSNGVDTGSSIVLLPNGQIVLGGDSSQSGNQNFALSSHDWSDGDLAADFGTGARRHLILRATTILFKAWLSTKVGIF